VSADILSPNIMVARTKSVCSLCGTEDFCARTKQLIKSHRGTFRRARRINICSVCVSEIAEAYNEFERMHPACSPACDSIERAGQECE